MNNDPNTPPLSPSALPLHATDEPPVPAKPKGPTFAQLGLRPEILRAVEDMGFSEPMAVQATTFPLITEGRDLMVQSRTGSGKTAAFGIPFGNSIVNADEKFVQALVLLPTRELALQVAAELAKIVAHRQIVVVPIYGGAPMGRQVEQLRAGGQIVCGTPGRVLDHLRRGTLKLDRVKCAVLDECDEMLSMGFQEDIEAILERTPELRQTLLFSATVPEGIQRLSRRFLRNPEFLKLSADFVGVHEIKHLYYSIPGVNRENELLRILTFEEPKTAIIFCNTREETSRVAEFLRKQGHEAEAISSDLSQSDRERVMARMRAGGIRFLVATDVAARGIDIENLSYVFNYTFPEAPEIYIHRTGRTGRAGKQGTAVSLIGPTEVGSFYYLKLLYKIKPQERALPSEVEIRSRREGERLLVLRQGLADDPGAEWKGLARRLMGAIDAERLVASLLARSFAQFEGMPAAPKPAAAPRPAAAPVAAVREPVRDRERERPVDRERSAGFRERTERAPREREARRGRERTDRPARTTADSTERTTRPESERSARPEGADRVARPEGGERVARPEGGERVARPEGGERVARFETDPPARPEAERPARLETDRPAPERFGRADAAERSASADRPPRRAERGFRAESTPRVAATPTEREFWEVWSEEKAAGLDELLVPESFAATVPEPRAPERFGAPPPAGRARDYEPGADSDGDDVARLYLNVGRKDGAGDREILDLLTSHAGVSTVLSMDVMNTHTYINVTPAEADRICASLTGKEVAGRDLLCERAKPRRR